MPFVLLFAGILLLIVAIRNEQTAFVQLVKADFTGKGNFMWWVLALLILGAIGYIPKARPVANLFIVLVLVVLILKRGQGGIFQELTNAIGATNVNQPAGAAGISSIVGTAVAAAATGVQPPTTSNVLPGSSNISPI